MISAIILSAGKGSRMGSDIPKQYLYLCDKPVIYYSLKTFEDSRVDNIVLVCGKDDVDYCKELVKKYNFTKVGAIVTGGKERYHSVYNGLEKCKGSEYVFIHDGARAFVDNDIIERCYADVIKYRACVAAVPLKDTIKIGRDGFIESTPDRSTLYSMQTPQVFDYELIFNSYLRLIENETEILSRGINVTDDTFVLELFSDVKVFLSEGSYKNIKITTPEDMKLGEIFINE